jgi:hypothetical protein
MYSPAKSHPHRRLAQPALKAQCAIHSVKASRSRPPSVRPHRGYEFPQQPGVASKHHPASFRIRARHVQLVSGGTFRVLQTLHNMDVISGA